jgi:hypothetical protein
MLYYITEKYDIQLVKIKKSCIIYSIAFQPSD